MSKDNYTFVNPSAGQWDRNELQVVDRPGDMSSYTFDTGLWEFTISIEVKRKPELIEAGQGWWDDRVDNFETESVEIVGLIERDSVTYVAYMDYEGATYLSDESYFRSNFHRELNS